MTKINNINIKNSILTPQTTGYIAAAGMGLAVLKGKTKSKFINKNHKVFAGISLAAVITHILIVGSRHIHMKKKEIDVSQFQKNFFKKA